MMRQNKLLLNIFSLKGKHVVVVDVQSIIIVSKNVGFLAIFVNEHRTCGMQLPWNSIMIAENDTLFVKVERCTTLCVLLNAFDKLFVVLKLSKCEY